MQLTFDIGGTHMRFGLVGESQKLISTKVIETPDKAEDGVKKILEFASDTKIYKTVGAIAGVLDKSKSKLYKSPNLPGWEDFDVKKNIEKGLGCEVFLENDAVLAGLGEAIYGAGKGFSIVSYLTISTGVGGSRIVNGKIDEKSYGFEPGSQYIFTGKNKRTTLEDLISGSAIKKIYQKEAEDIKDKTIWKQIIKIAAIGLTNLNVFWSPDIIILGGGVASNGLFDLNMLRSEMEKLNIKYPKLPVFRKSALGDYSGIYGGIALLRRI